ncbi:MAG: 50S ribosomal protein L3 [Candidatus Portnoybacteria bacterium CG10_big_fil_rev_8_21_14_0_10_38_18]|uniref:Large ribosomal subunit protein uL3 n=1 Tax=Candidatus Portnoybacteria bacterium CG10_big_fil_rev_8_21_14_0_10_38_18 TaxID=1974813 RepID=A0A2M8KCG0_9BACT|nr:MAG: 50S ribosomal protein L3 [Candidatus Portnoybacteria bacterium CG10_big_fil_rev_8_21_14_0_10_38_18]
MRFILGKKLGMSQIFDKQGNAVPITVIEAGPCFVTQIREKDKNGYRAVQIGFNNLKQNKIKRPQKDKPFKHIKEFRLVNDDKSDFKTGDKIDVSVFSEGDRIKVSAISRGKGFQGVVKRHGFSGGPASHGHRHVLRRPGSIGSSFPERVIKGKKMPGRAGAKRVTIKNLKIALVDSKNNLLAVSGTVPGPSGSLVEIKSI